MFDFLIQLNRDLGKCFGTGTSIPAGADLDDYATPGAYYSVDTNTTATLKNVPSWITTGFRMEVINTTITGWFIQKLYSNHKIQNTTIRLHAGTQYLDWHRSLTNGDIDGLTASQQPSLNRANMVVKTPAGTKFQFLFGDNGTVKIEKDSGSGWEGAKQIFP